MYEYFDMNDYNKTSPIKQHSSDTDIGPPEEHALSLRKHQRNPQ